MSTNGAPESWEDADDVSSKLNALNVNAASFVPNVNAPAFVPNFGAPPPVVAAAPPVAVASVPPPQKVAQPPPQVMKSSSRYKVGVKIFPQQKLGSKIPLIMMKF